MAKRPIEDVLRAHVDELMGLPGVVGVYQGARDDGSPCIRVMVVEDDPALATRIPKSLEGYPVEIEVSGRIRPMPGDGR